MMKIVPASRLVTDASLDPPRKRPRKRPAIARRRAVAPAGGAVVDCVSITAKAEIPGAPRGGGDGSMYQRIVKIRLGAGPTVVPAKAGTHNHRGLLSEDGVCQLVQLHPPQRVGPGLRQAFA